MSGRRITGAEARELAAKATPGEWGVMSNEGPVRLPSGERVGGWMHSICAGSGRLMNEGHVCIGHAFTKADDMPAHDAALMAAAPDLAESLAAVEAERDALMAATAPLMAAAERYAAARRAYDATPRIEDDTDPCDPREAGLPCAVDEPASELARAGQALLALAALREAAK